MKKKKKKRKKKTKKRIIQNRIQSIQKPTLKLEITRSALHFLFLSILCIIQSMEIVCVVCISNI